MGSSFPSMDFSLAGDFHPQFGLDELDELSYSGMDFTSTFNPSVADWNATCEQEPPLMPIMAPPQSPPAESPIANFHYEQCLSQIIKIYGRSFDDVEFMWPVAYDPVTDQNFSVASTEDIDALFVSCFFLALFDQMAARPSHIRKIFRFISHVLQVPNVRDNMGGVRSRVSTWVWQS